MMFIVKWTGDCQIEADNLEQAVAEMKKNGQLVVTCSRFEGREIEGEKDAAR